MRALVGSQRIGDHRVPFGPSEEAVVKTALQTLTGYPATARPTETTIPALWQALDQPSDTLVETCRYADHRDFLDATRLLRDALGQLVSGALAGLFDGHTTIDVDWNAPIQSLSLSRLTPLGDEAIGIALLCLNSWGRGMREVAPPGDLRIAFHISSRTTMRMSPGAAISRMPRPQLFRQTRAMPIASSPRGLSRDSDSDWMGAFQSTAMLSLIHISEPTRPY